MSGRRSRFATISDVARRAGVSKMTVSRVLRGSPDVREETRARVLQAIEELQYVPSFSARALANHRTTNIALVVGHAPRFDDFFNYVAKAAELELAKRGYNLILAMQQMQEEKELPMLVRQRKVDGLLLGGPEFHPSLIESLLEAETPCVLLANRLADLPVSTVCADDFGGAFAAVHHLVSLGHEKVGFVATRIAYYHVRERYRGYLAALQTAGVKPRPEWTVEVSYSQDEGRKATHQLLSLSDRPTAIFYSGDLLALGGMAAAREAGISIPEELAVVGFDDIRTASVMHPALTTVRVDKEEMGRQAVRILFEPMAGSEEVQHVTVPTELVVRESCGSTFS